METLTGIWGAVPAGLQPILLTTLAVVGVMLGVMVMDGEGVSVTRRMVEGSGL